jgi:hypothetical protein
MPINLSYLAMTNYRLVQFGSDLDTSIRAFGDGFGNGSYCTGVSAVYLLQNVIFPAGFTL